VIVRWTPAAARRVVYSTRLRKRGVNGHVLPLLLWVRDGWGWEHIRSAVLNAARQAAEDDWRHLQRWSPVRTVSDVLAKVEEHGAWAQAPNPEAALAFQQKAWTLIASGTPRTTTDLKDVPIGFLLFDAIGEEGRRELGITCDPRVCDECEPLRHQAALLEQRRVALRLPARKLRSWIGTLDDANIERGRLALLNLGGSVRRALRRIERASEPQPRSGIGNVLTGFGMSRAELEGQLRSMTGRYTAAQTLAMFIAQGILIAKMAEVEPQLIS
jgi:hypothetical protein